MPTNALRGVIAAAATPIHPDSSPHLAKLLPHLKYLLDHGCDAINLLGTTGEANSFGLADRLGIMRAVKAGGLPMERFMVGTGVCSLSETAELTNTAAELGYAGALVLPPFFYPGIEPAALVAYVDELVQRTAKARPRLYLYHIPQNTGVPWPVEVVGELAKRHPERVRGIKDSSGDMAYARAVVKQVAGFDVFPSTEAVLADADVEGFAGCISASANLTAIASQEAWTHRGTERGRVAAQRAAAQRTVLSREALVANVKSALAMRYDDTEWARTCHPLTPRSAEQGARLRNELAGVGLAFSR